MGRAFGEYLRMFEEKTGKPFRRNRGAKMFYYPERGFAEIGVDREHSIVVLFNVSGDGMFWRRIAEMMAELLEIPCCGTIALRGIKAYIRRYGYRVEHVEHTEEGMERYFCVGADGRKGTCSPAFLDEETGRWAYFITWEARKCEIPV